MFKNISDLTLQFSEQNYIFTTKWVIFNSETIHKDSIIVISNEDGFVFHCVQSIALNKHKNCFFLVTKKMLDCYMVEHYQAFKIFDSNNFIDSELKMEELAQSVITYKVMLSDVYDYINTSWF